jgi:predicted adenine nucleotide alpha hydrolase (AANH) superfamily ATPase
MRRKVSIDQEMRGIMAGAESSGIRPRLLLHVCCAPCSSAVLEQLANAFQIIVYFDNPNLDTRQEHNLRAGEAQRLVDETGWAERVIVTPYDPSVFYSAVHGFENEPEGGVRCAACFSLRLYRSAVAARELQCDYFTTTLTISPRKDTALLNRIGLESGRQAGIPFLSSDFKKRGGYQRSIDLSREYRLYRQDYCGCAYSKLVSRDGETTLSSPLSQ